MLEPRITLITCGVADLQAARRWYQQFGLAESEPAMESIAFFPMTGCMLGLWSQAELAQETRRPATDTPGAHNVTLAQNVGSRSEVDQILTRAADHGARVIPPVLRDWGGYSGYFTCPAGITWEIAAVPFLFVDSHGTILNPVASAS